MRPLAGAPVVTINADLTRVLAVHQPYVSARQDDYSNGVLHSRAHEVWSLRMGTSLEDRPRSTPTTCFETFPLPWPPGQELKDNPRVAAIAAAAKDLDEKRRAWLDPPAASADVLKKRTLTNLYNERPTWLALLHADLDRAVWAAYGWEDADPAAVAEDAILARLLALNAEQRRDSGLALPTTHRANRTTPISPVHAITPTGRHPNARASVAPPNAAYTGRDATARSRPDGVGSTPAGAPFDRCDYDPRSRTLDLGGAAACPGRGPRVRNGRTGPADGAGLPASHPRHRRGRGSGATTRCPSPSRLGRLRMATLFAITYPELQRAAQAMAAVEQSDADHLIRLRAACWIGKENGDLAVHPRERSGTGEAAAGGALWLLVGALFALPVVGLAAGAAVGRHKGRHQDGKIDEAFVAAVGDRLAAGGSAVVVLFEEGADSAQAGAALARFGGTVHSTDLPADRLTRFQAALDQGGGRLPRVTGEATDAEGRLVRQYEAFRFGAVEVGGPAEVVYEPGAACAFAVAAAPPDHAHVTIRLVGDVLHVAWDAGALGRRKPATPLAYRLVAPRVDELRLGERITAKVDGLASKRLNLIVGKESTLAANGLATERLSLDVGQGSTVAVTGLKAQSLTAQVAPGARATVAGTADRHAVAVGEGGSYDGSGLVAREVTAEARPGALVAVRAEQALKASAEGTGRVTYVGKPSKMTTDARNGGTVTQAD